MGKYVALLRGININGKNRIAMPALKHAFEEAGFSDVMTYINSGNVIFSSNLHDKRELIAEIESLIEEGFNLRIPVTVLTVDELSYALENAPSWWGTESKEVYHNAIFMIPPTSPEEIFEAVGEAIAEYEQVIHCGNVIYWSAVLKTFSKTKWSKIASSSVNNKVTIRNANTIRKLAALIHK